MSLETIQVLSIEDNPADAQLIRAMLQRATTLGWDLPRFELIGVDSLRAALDHLQGGDVDVVLTDLDLPDSRAGETYVWLRSHAPEVPIVVLTGREDEALARNTVRAGAEDYLFKREMSGSLLAHALLYAIERRRIKSALQEAHDNLERRVQNRTVQLEQANLELQREVTERQDAEEALREGEAKTRSILRAAPIGIGVVVDRVFVDVNDRFCEITGYAREELVGKNAQVVYPTKEAYEHVGREKYRQIRERGTGTVETQFKRKDGQIIDVLLSSTPLDSHDLSIGVTFTVLEVTERKQVEKALREGEERYRALVNSSPSSIVVVQQRRYAFVNPAGAKMLGYADPEALIGVPVLETIAPDSRQRVLERMERLSAGEENPPLKIELLRPDGSVLTIESTSVPIQLHGEPATLVVGRDISERERTERALWESERQKDLILNATAEMVAYYDTDLRVIWANRASAESVGMSTEDLVGLHCYQIWHQRDEPCPGCPVLKARDSELPQEGEQRTPDGRYWWLRGYPVFDERGEVVSLVEFGQDITDRKRTEAQLRRYAAELERSNFELQQFAHIVSHDLREPLRTIRGFVQLLAEDYQDRLDDKADEYIDLIVDGVGRMQELLQSLLDYARVGSQDQQPGTADGEEMFRRALALLGTAIEESEAEITHDSLPLVWVDPVEMTQLLQNLIGNALKFRGPKPPRVHVTAEREDGGWLFAVQDNGIGIDPQHHQEIFEPFRRLHTREEYPGTGMGLAICAKIASRLGGRIWVESELNEGATFYFSVPDGPAGQQ